MVCPANAAFNRAAAFAALTQTLDTRPSRVAGSCFHQSGRSRISKFTDRAVMRE
jgi:hypothetical protein